MIIRTTVKFPICEAKSLEKKSDKALQPTKTLLSITKDFHRKKNSCCGNIFYVLIVH